ALTGAKPGGVMSRGEPWNHRLEAPGARPAQAHVADLRQAQHDRCALLVRGVEPDPGVLALALRDQPPLAGKRRGSRPEQELGPQTREPRPARPAGGARLE